MVVIAILASLAAIGYGPIIEHMNDGERQKANSNLKSVFTLLHQFKQDNGCFPCDATAERLQEDNSDLDFGELKGSNSNAYFRQLFFKNGVDSEKPFYAKVNAGNLTMTQEGDERISNGQALRPGENAMSYVLRRDPQDPAIKIAVTKTNAPLAMCSLYPSKTPYAGDKLSIDIASFGKHFFVLSCDGSVTDREKDIVDTESEDIGSIKSGVVIFPETKRGRSTAQDYLVLTPES